jgi:polysaccharide chain length determinant protein (PEP-CTERM system associated)
MNNIFDELRAALHSVWHRRWLALAIAWGLCLLGWLMVATIPNSYESRARIYVQLDDMLAQQIGIGQGDRKQGVDRVRQTLTSAVNLEKVIRSTPIGAQITTPKQMEMAVLELGKMIKVESSQENLFIITASYGDGSNSDAQNAKIAQLIVQKMIDIFREENLSGNRGEMSTSLEFMDAQLAQRQKELSAAEAKRLQFEAQNPSLAGGAGAGLQKLEAARAELRGIDADLAAAQSALAAINGQMAGTPRTIAGAAGPVGGARGALNEAQAQLNSLRARGLTENHPDVIAARNQVGALRAAASAEGGGGPQGMPNPAYSSLESIRAERQANVQALSARRAAAQQEISTLTAQQFSNPAAAGEYQQITRDYDVLKQQYDKLLQNREQLRIRGSIETEHNSVRFQVIDPPASPRSPISPNRPLLLFGVLVMGLGAGVSGAFAISHLRSTFSTASRLEKALGLPVLGAISQTISENARALRRKRLKYFYAASSGLVGLFVILLTIEFVQRGMVA